MPQAAMCSRAPSPSHGATWRRLRGPRLHGAIAAPRGETDAPQGRPGLGRRASEARRGRRALPVRASLALTDTDTDTLPSGFSLALPPPIPAPRPCLPGVLTRRHDPSELGRSARPPATYSAPGPAPAIALACPPAPPGHAPAACDVGAARRASRPAIG